MIDEIIIRLKFMEVVNFYLFNVIYSRGFYNFFEWKNKWNNISNILIVLF